MPIHSVATLRLAQGRLSGEEAKNIDYIALLKSDIYKGEYHSIRYDLLRHCLFD
ncbi:MAG TPA: hypothetical protein VNN20_09420 [Thermodesulfobacteriota bacterium]|nr:hypothetical protein [Thermodesulfobacteriota bacterium]